MVLPTAWPVATLNTPTRLPLADTRCWPSKRSVSETIGAAVRPLCAEAELLSLIDAVDSRMEIYRETYDTMEAETFSPRIFALEKKVFKHR